MKHQNTRRGFTLIELLIVVLIIGILAAVAVPQYQRVVRKARVTEILIQVKAIKNAVDLFVLEGNVPNDTMTCWNLDLKDKLSITFPSQTLAGGYSASCSCSGTCKSCAISCSVYGSEIGRIGGMNDSVVPLGIWYDYRDGMWNSSCAVEYINGGADEGVGAEKICRELLANGMVDEIIRPY